jgi:very-short-patch-repair endonuclease
MNGATTAQARRLRRDASPVEVVLWEVLRGRRLADARFRRQYPCGPYILDFFCPEARLAVEVDGAQHAEPTAEAYDARRDTWLWDQRKIRVLRFSSAEVLNDMESVRNAIFDALQQGGPR